MAAKKSTKKQLSEKDAFKQLETLFGSQTIFHPLAVQKVDIISTGSPLFDLHLGVGGIPRGRVVQFAGKEASGKTFLALQVAAQWQKMHPDNCFAFLDAEYTYDPKWTKRFDIDNDRVFLVKDNRAEKLFTGLVGDIKVNPKTKAETKIFGLFDMIEAGIKITVPNPTNDKNVTLDLSRCGLIIVDSIAALQPPAERTANIGKQNIALLARFLSVELKKITPAAAKSNAAVIFINQIRVDPGKMFGSPDTSPGGNALKHACSLMINFGQLNKAEDKIFDDLGTKIGHRVRTRIQKIKLLLLVQLQIL